VRRFSCSRCGADVSFESVECDNCGTALGLFPDAEIRAVEPIDNAAFVASGATDSTAWWRCLNSAWGCNWMVAAESGAVWCSSCRLTRGRPDDESIDAVIAWSTTEQAKRRLVFQLWTLGLPIDSGVVFDLVFLPDSRGVTGHSTGVVTIDLREADDAFRDAARVAFHEADRTLIGHLRHEIGHHYFQSLVIDLGALDEFRALFGDERSDYGSALDSHYDLLGRHVDVEHISGYAAAHPSEDWAECFAHYLHVRDAVETLSAYEVDDVDQAGTVDDVDQAGTPGRQTTLAGMVDRWRRVSVGVNEVAAGLGHRRPYPFTITPAVEAKLAFVHRQIAAATAG
jgi:hypothetical protein